MEAWIALVGTLFGGVALKAIEKYLARGGEKVDIATKMRDEIRKDLAEAKNEARLLEKELNEWKMKYYLLLEENMGNRTELKHLRGPVSLDDKEVEW